MKVRDSFSCEVADQDGQTIGEYEGYVPGFFPRRPLRRLPHPRY